MLEEGRRRLRAGLDASSADGPSVALPDAVCRGLLAGLRARLTRLGGRVLQQELCRHRPPVHALLHLFDVPRSGPSSRHLYESFVQEFARNGLESLFDRYPVLGRYWASVVDFWAEAAVELVLRLDRDRPALEQHFGGGESLGRVVALEAGLSDPHHRGRSIHILTFDHGVKVVYKPRDVATELAFSRFVEWCNQRFGLLPLRVLQILDRSGYGWTEYVERAECEDEAAVERLYQRAGMLLGLIYVLRGTDCHYQNIIVSGEQIVLIDAEAMMHPPADEGARGWLVRPGVDVLEAFSYSVVSTGLLPSWAFHEDGLAYDLSGLSCTPGQELPGVSLQWKDVGSDDMRIEAASRYTEERPNCAVLHGVRLPPDRFIGFIVRGWTEIYQFILEARADLLLDGPLEGFRDRQIRVILRDTAEYGLFLQHLCDPEQLQQEVDASAELDRFTKGSRYDPAEKRGGEILQAEARALQGLDVPCFRALSTSRSISTGVDQPVDDYFLCSGFDAALEQLRRLSREDLARQAALIEGAFQAHSARIELTSDERCTDEDSSPIPATVSPAREHLLGEATRIAEEIEHRAWICADGAAHWLGLDYDPRARRFQSQVLGDCLLNGNCGIALFLAALDHVAARPRFRDLVVAALLPLRRFKSEGNEREREELARRIGIGAGIGAGALIYGLTRVGRLLSDESLYEDARWYAELITPEMVERDRHLGVLSGAAGAILGLLALHGETGDATLLHRASICAAHLLEHRSAAERPLPAPSGSAASNRLAGLAEGALGIGLALRRLHAVAPDERYRAAAHEAFPSDVGPARVVTDDFPGTRPGVDGLCFGQFGQIELLFATGEELSSGRLCEAARIRAAHLASRARALGGYRLFANQPRQTFNPGLLLGTAGVGYSLLRLAASEALPSVLMWE